ncbi:MAG: hypothetical protein WB697_22090 [Stellaceae bacterium]
MLDHFALTENNFADPVTDDAKPLAQPFNFGDDIPRRGIDG